MTREELFHKWEYEGWDYILCDIDPDELEDAALGEALADAQEAFQILQSLFPTWEEIEGDDDVVEEGEYWED